MDEKTNQNDATTPTTDSNNLDKKSAKPQKSAMRWLLPLILAALIVNIFLQKEKPTIDWIEDHSAGLKLAKEQKKPALLIFFKKNVGFCNDAWDGTYTNQTVIDYAAKNLVTIFIDIDKQPELAEQYKIDYYPTHLLIEPETNDILGAMRGYDPPTLFISKIEEFLTKTN